MHHSFLQLFRGRLRSSLLIAAVALLTTAGLQPLFAQKQPESMPTASMTVTSVKLQAATLARTVPATGTIHPWQEVQIGPEVGGYRVVAVNVDVGDRVRRGQELVRLNEDLLASEVNSKKANVTQAEATLANAHSAYDRARSLSVSGALSASDLDKLKSEQLAAAARVEVARAELESAELRLRYTRVLAPDDGVITSRSVSLGQIAQTGTEMLRLLRKNRVEWRAEVPEAQLKNIKRGQTVKLTTAGGDELIGRVRTVAPTIQSSNRTGLIYVDIDESENARAGMFARGTIEIGQSQTQLAPLASLVMQDGYSYVFLLKPNNEVERRRVEVGVIQGDTVEIVSGVQPNDSIVHRGAGFLKDGDRVNVASAAGG